MSEVQYPSERVDLPSKGWFYPDGHPLTSGQIDLFYMTAKHEDILTSTNLIQKGVVLDKLMEALIATPSVRYDDLLLGDKNGLLIAARILGYGKEYQVGIDCPKCGEHNITSVNLETLSEKNIDFNPSNKGKNEFDFLLPVVKKTITFKLLTHGDEKSVNAELAAMRKIIRDGATAEVTTRIRKSILAVDGNRDPKFIREFVDAMPARDAMAFREYANKINPNIDLNFDFTCTSCGAAQRMEVPIDVTFFWPNAKV